jgi:biotin carboxyl carrier protein
MKMEHAVAAPIAGRISELRVALGAQVQRGQVLAVVDP